MITISLVLFGYGLSAAKSVMFNSVNNTLTAQQEMLTEIEK
jgi:hypothetical protein